MSVHELNLRPVDDVPDFALTALRRWAAEKPLQIALRHTSAARPASRWISASDPAVTLPAGQQLFNSLLAGRLGACTTHQAN